VTEKRDQILGALARWANANGIPRPKDQAGMNRLLQRFIAAQPAWFEIPDDRTTHLIDDGATIQIADAKVGGQFMDDWDQLLQQRSEAMAEAHGDDFNRDFLLSGKEQAELQAAAPFARTNPVSVLQGILGGTANVTQGTSVNIARWEGADAETTAVTVTLGPVETVPNLDGIDANTLFRPYGIIQWGTRGFPVTAQVDIGRGCQFTINASFVNLSLAMEANTALPNGFLGLTGLLSYQPCVRTQNLTRSLYVDGLANGGTTTDLVIPRFAKQFTLWRSDARNAIGIVVEGYAGSFSTIYSFTRAAAATVAETAAMTPLPLTGDSVYLRLTNAGSSSTNIVVVFDLAL